MNSKNRSLAVFLIAAFIATSFSLCQKGPREVTTSMESVVVDETPIEFDEVEAEGKALPKPPKLYVGEWNEKGEKPEAFKKAQKEFEKKTYKTALEKYADFVKDDPTNYWAADSRLQMARCHYQLSEFDEALDVLTKFLESKPGLLWEARGMTTLSELYLTLPYSGYERDGKVHYNYDDREGEYRYMSEENKDTAVSQREKARLAYIALLAAPAAKRGASPGDDLKAEAVANNFFMVNILENMFWSHYDRCPPAEPLDPPKPGSIHDPEWTTREKNLYLLDEVTVFNQGRKDRHPEAWAGFKKALFLMRFPECATKEHMKKEEKLRAEWEKKHKDEFDPDPFDYPRYEPPDELNPIKIISKVIKNFPDDRDADFYFATKARVYEGRAEFLKAKKVYEQFLEKFPKSRWKDDARSSLHDMQHPRLDGRTDGIGYSGEDDVLNISSRNVKDVAIAIYEIDLPKILQKSKVLNKPFANFTDTYSYFKDFKGAKKYCKKKVHALSYTTRDKGDFKHVYGRVKLPKLAKGSYLILSRSGNVEFISIFVKTDMIVVGKPVADSFQYLVTDSGKGKPQPGIALVIKESYYDYSAKGYNYSSGYNRKVKITKAKTDTSGRFTYQLTKGNDISSNSVAILAYSSKRMAITRDQYGSYYSRSETDETFKIFTTTDRPVYRPGDTMRFKHVVRSYKDGKNNNVPGRDVKMEVTNTKGERIFQKTEKTTGFGTVWGEIKIEDDAPLGVYNARAYVEGSEQRSYQSSGSQFRVEEYKKPEFEVKVEPQKPLAAAGEKVSALIKATYYWGAPVSGGKVKYHIYRSVYWHNYRPPDKWDWLYGSGFGIIYDHPYAGGEELLSDGEGVTDDLGMMEVTLPEMEEDSEYDYEYRITAEVTDLSRRTIEGAGSVKFTRDPFYVHIVTPLSFYTENDKVEAEILAMTADDEPVPAKGTVEIVRMTYPAAEEEKEEIIKEAKIEMDEKGRAFYKFQFKDAGQYKFRFRGKHKGKKVVEGERLITVAGKKFDKKRFRFSNIEIVSQKRTYKRGEEVKVLIATPWEDATIWLSHEGGSEILDDRIEQPAGGSYVMTFKAEEKHQPNFHVRAIVVRENRVHTLTREIFIPPDEGILEAVVESSQAEFKPRDKGKLSITVRDHKGEPLQGEFSLSVFDSSVLYIQAETGGDIRSYYYGDRRYCDVYPFFSTQIYFSDFSHDGNKWPELSPAGLPTSSGYFYMPMQPGMLFSCPSCFQNKLDYFSVGSSFSDSDQDGILDTADTGVAMNKKKMVLQPQSAVQADMPAGSSWHSGGGGGGMGFSAGLGKKGGGKMLREKSGKMDYKAAGKDAAADVEVREYFPDTALWKPDVVTDKDGKASIDIAWPDSLTTWAVRVVGVDKTNKVAIAKTSVVTTKKLVARLETPRFMVEGDTAKLAAVIRNDYPEPLDVTLEIKIEGEGIEAIGPTQKKILVPAGKDARKDFEVRAIHAENVKIKLTAVSKKDSDALLKTFEVMEWGSDKMVSASDILRKPGKMRLELDVPKERRKESSELVFTAEPSMAGSLLRALPYLIHYPYGCVEQTMSRFLPAVLVSRTLKESGVKLSDIPAMAEKASLADPYAKRFAEAQLPWWQSPVYDDKLLEKYVKVGLKKLYDYQHADGGWAWWKEGPSDPYMSTYVLIGLVEARSAGYKIDGSRIDRGMKFLKKSLKKLGKKQGSPRELRAYIGYALSMDKKVKVEDLKDVYDHREDMSHYGQALISLAMWNIEEKDKAKEALASLVDVAWINDKNKTASFKWEKKNWWHWYYDRVETVAWTLRAVMTINPSHKHADWFAKWLMLNRQGNHWYSTKDTSAALYGMTLYMSHHNELTPDCTVKISVNGEEKKSVKFNKGNALAGGGVVFMSGKEIGDGKLKIDVDMKGACSVYANAFLSYFTKEAKIEASGNEIFVERTYYKLKEKKKKVKTWRGVITKLDYERIELKEGDEVRSGDLIEVKIKVEALNDYEYLVFEDFKPAGCEPTELKSGGVFQHGTWINREMRDEKVVNFFYRLPQGKQAITYKMRAEIPGKFRILPHKGYAMYAPRVKAISDSSEMTITD